MGALAFTSAATAKPTAAKRWKAVGNLGFASTPMSSTGGVKLAVSKYGKLYAAVHSKTITSPSNEITVYAWTGSEWRKIGRRVTKKVAGLDLKVAPDGSVLLVCSKSVFRLAPGAKKFRMGMGTGRGYGGFSWGPAEDPHKWEKDMPLGREVKLAVDSKGTPFVAYASPFPRLLQYRPEIAKIWSSDSKCKNCDDNDVNVEFYPVGSFPAQGKRTGTEKSPGQKMDARKGVTALQLAINEKDEVFVAFNPSPGGVAWGFVVKKWDPKKNAFIPMGEFKGDEEGNPDGGYSDGRAEKLTFLAHGKDLVVAYKEDSNQDKSRQWKASAMRYDGSGDWLQMGKQGFSKERVDNLTLAKAKGQLYLAYDLGSRRGNKGQRVVVMRYNRNKNSWKAHSVVQENASNAHMIIGADNTMYVGFRVGNQIGVKKRKL